MLLNGGRWEPWQSPWSHRPFEEVYGQVWFRGRTYLTRTSRMGVPVLTGGLRTAILEAIAEARLELV